MATQMTTDPTCGMPIDPASARQTTDHDGQTYYFCSPGCKAAFETDPARYAAAGGAANPAASHDAHGGHGPHATPAHHGMHDMHGAHGSHGQQTAARGDMPGIAATGDADHFARDIDGLPDAVPTAVVELRDGDAFDLRATPVRGRVGGATVKLLGYNGSVPGPTLRVTQGSEITVRFQNELDLETTVHWHGLRHEHRFDGVPTGHHRGMQAPVPPGGDFEYRLRFPDAGVFWYHPHIREDYAQEHGLYGAIVVEPADPAYWPPVNRDVVLMVDDILIEDGQVAPFRRSGSDRTAMGRFGNVMLVNGQTDARVEANVGEVVRFYLTNTANTRVFNLRIPGARLKLVGGDNGRLEREALVEEVLLAPSERAVVDAFFERPGRLTLEHRTSDTTYALATVDVRERPVDRSHAAAFAALRTAPELEAERAALARDLERAPDKTLALVGIMPGMAHHGGMAGHDGEQAPPIEWEDTMAAMNRMSTPHTMLWQLVDRETGAANHEIAWAFRQGERVKIRIVNEPGSDHPMQHPFHIHGQRFLVLGRDGVPSPNLGWKDTVLVRTGETVDLLMDAGNPGLWMAHCHIAEHLEGGMMLSFQVGDEHAGYHHG
jgi:FtsP/CotA-like multicopper oxidase with cupredoxin domain/YHS domain-containing protein